MRRNNWVVVLAIGVLCCRGAISLAGNIAASATANGNWSLGSNWSTLTLVPVNSSGNTFDVTITGHTMTYNLAGSGQVNSLILSSAALNLSSTCNLSVINSSSITQSNIQSTGATFSDPATVVISSTFDAESAASISLPAMATFQTNNSGSGIFKANGSNSQVQLPNLTTINESGWGVSLIASSGGYVNAPQLATVTYSGGAFENLALTSQGTNSVVNVPSLGAGPLTKLQVNVQGGGSVLWGSPTTIQSSNITLDGGGTLNTAALTNIDSTSLTATNGATLSLPALATYRTNSSTSGIFAANNTNSHLQLPALTTINENGWGVTLTATGGGYVNAPLLSTITYSGSAFENLALTSQGTNSVVNVPSLGAGPLTKLQVSVQGGGSVLWGSPKTIQSSNITLDGGGTLNTAALTNIDSTSLTATNGATLTLPVLATYRTNSTTSGSFTANNTNSFMQLPALNTINENGWSATLTATGGGYVNAPQLASITYSGSAFENLSLNSRGLNSVVNVPAIGSGPLTKLQVNVQGGGSILWGSPTNIQSSNITVDGGGTLNTAALTNIDSTSLTATNGATLTMPALATYRTNSTTAGSFTASNTNSHLQLPALTTINENGWSATLMATSGGYVNAPQLASVTYSGSAFEKLAFTSQGTNSIINVPSLGSGPLTKLQVNVQGGGSVLWGSPTSVQSSNITLDGSGTLNTAGLTNIDSTSLTAVNGATLTLPVLTTYRTNSTTSGTFTANNAASQLQFPALTSVNENGWGLTLAANAGGHLDLHSLHAITGSGSIFEAFNVNSSNANSLVDLSGLYSTTGINNTLDVADSGEIELGAPASATTLTFRAEFNNANGPLDIFVNGTLLEAIAPNNLNTFESYQASLSGLLAGNNVITFEALGSNANINVSDYSVKPIVTPEPGALALLAPMAALLLRRTRRFR